MGGLSRLLTVVCTEGCDFCCGLVPFSEAPLPSVGEELPLPCVHYVERGLHSGAWYAEVSFLIVGVWPCLPSNRGFLLSEGCAMACQQLWGKVAVIWEHFHFLNVSGKYSVRLRNFKSAGFKVTIVILKMQRGDVTVEC